MTDLVSVFTPTHDCQYMIDCYESLVAQSYDNWEWIIVLNNHACLPQGINKDPRVSVYIKDDLHKVGELKGYACSQTSGKYLVELDHDDILMPNALGEIVKAFHWTNSEFIYSEFIQTDENLKPESTVPFSVAYGWQYDFINIGINGENNDYIYPMSPNANFPHNASLIWYAPNHVRAFTKSLYNKVGGYNPLDILDDQDLMCRMFEKTDFHFIQKPLYFQRNHAKNTQKDLKINEKIQKQTIVYYQQYVQNMALAWAKRKDLLCLDLGAAYNKPDGYLGVDIQDIDAVDYVGDIIDVLKGFEDNSVGVIRAVDFFEHIPNKITIWNEMYRVLAHGGMILSLTPSSDGRAAFQDPTHVAFYNINSFWYYTDGQFASFVPEIKCKFQVSYLENVWLSEWHQENNMPYVNANLIAIKDGPRQMGFNKW